MQAAAKRRAKERDLGLNGHKLIAFQPVWSEWPRPKKGKPQKGQLFTCQKCWGIANYNKHMWKPCTGSCGEASRQAVNRWAGICAGPSGDNVSTLLACWGTTKAEADMYFNHLEEEGRCHPALFSLDLHLGGFGVHAGNFEVQSPTQLGKAAQNRQWMH